MRGSVKWFNGRKGYGFLIGEDGAEYFAHYSNIDMEGYKNLKADQKVTFDTDKDSQGRSCATHIKPLAE